MTPADLRRLCETEVSVPLLVALDALGVSETAGRQAEKRGELPFTVVRVGKVLRVPTRDLAALLLTDGDGAEVSPDAGTLRAV